MSSAPLDRPHCPYSRKIIRAHWDLLHETGSREACRSSGNGIRCCGEKMRLGRVSWYCALRQTLEIFLTCLLVTKHLLATCVVGFSRHGGE